MKGPCSRVKIKSTLVRYIPRNIADELPPEGAVLPLDGDEGAGDGVRLQDTGHAHRR